MVERSLVLAIQDRNEEAFSLPVLVSKILNLFSFTKSLYSGLIVVNGVPGRKLP